jgi:hypothetical protein
MGAVAASEWPMGLFDIFRRTSRIRELAGLGALIDAHAAALAQESVEDYSRLRAGAHAEELFAAPPFRAALERAGAEAYPIALAMVGETVEAVLRPQAGEHAHPMLYGLIRLILELFDRKPAPPAIGITGWRAARQDVSRTLIELLRRKAKPVERIAESYTGVFLALMPLHEKLRGENFEALREQLTLAASKVRDEITERADVPRLIEQLRAGETAT